MTNEQKIKAMSTEELAKGIEHLVGFCIDCPAFMACCDTIKNKKCSEHLIGWLKEEAEE